MATGAVSEKSSTSNGVDRLQQRLSDPHVAAGLNRLLDRVDSIAFAVEAFEGFVARGDVIANSVASAVSEFKGANHGPAHPNRLASILEQAPEVLDTGSKLANVGKQAHLDDLAASRLVERLTEPETLALLNQLLEKLPLIVMMVQSAEGLIRRGDTIAENVADLVHDLKLSEKTPDLEQLASLFQSLPQLQKMGEQLLNSGLVSDGLPKVIDAGISMIESGMMDKQVVATLGELGKASANTYEEVRRQNPPPIGGLFAMMRATKDPDIQKSLGFFFAFAKAFAKNLS